MSYARMAELQQAVAREVLADPDVESLSSYIGCLLYTSDAADERSSVDLGGRRIIKKKSRVRTQGPHDK